MSAPYSKRRRQPGEAMPNQYDMRSDVYVPLRDNPQPPVRPGSLDFLEKPSKGNQT